MTSRLLGLETSGPLASVAVSVDGRIAARRFLHEQRRHAARLLPAMDQVMTEARVSRGDLTGVVVGTGPGSFTGVRVAASAGKGVAHALGIPLFGVSSLLAAALGEAVPREAWDDGPTEAAPDHVVAFEGGLERLVLFDARGDRLFCACLRLARGADPEAGGGPGLASGLVIAGIIEPPSFRHLSDLLEDRTFAGVPHCGSGAIRHAEALAEDGRVVLPAPAGVPSADGLLVHMASSSAPPPLVNPFDWEPRYLRDTGAVRGRSP